MKYAWKTSDSLSEFADYPGSTNVACQGSPVGSGYCTAPVRDGCLYQYAAPVVKTREVGFTRGGSADQTQTFTYSTSWGAAPYAAGWTQKATQVATTDDVRGVSATTNYTYSPLTITTNDPLDFTWYPPQVPLESQIAYYDNSVSGQGPLLKTVNKIWLNQYQIKSIQTTLPSGSASQFNYSYANSPFSLVQEEEEDEYGPTTNGPTRMTSTSYQQFTGAPGYLADRACSVVVCSGGSSGSSCSSSSSNRIAETDFLYDGGAATCGVPGSKLTTLVSGLPSLTNTHDEALFSASSTTPRGNVTEEHKLCWPNCPNAITKYAYDETGQVTSMTDPKGYPTLFSFSDNPVGGNAAGNSNAYLTNITYPTVNGVTPQKSFTYNYTTGELATAKDENGQVTTYCYMTGGCSGSTLDPFDRLTETDYPDTGKTTISYQDSPPNPTITTSILQTPNPTKTSVSTMDGMGHVIQTSLTSDPAGADNVAITYDGEGEVYTKTNPFRGGTPPTGITTTYYYDALGRPIKTAMQDGNTLQWCYNSIASTPAVYCSSSQLGSVTKGTTWVWVDSTDENGNHWQRTSDAFGRLLDVMEPNGTSKIPTMETDYAYDGLNNLLSVTQWGGVSGSSGERVRSFSYDSLSRLVAASNPETASTANPPSLTCAGASGSSWTTCYGYDLNSNLTSKTDNRSVVTSYFYDALNRLLSKSYSSNANGTPLSCYQYDLPAATCSQQNGSQQNANLVGRLTSAWTQSALTTSSCSTTASFLTKRSIFCYDAMGRIKTEQQYTQASQASGKTYAPAYTYDLAGNLLTSTDGTTPSPATPGVPVTFTNTVDGAGRLLTVTSNWFDSTTHPSTLFSAQTETTTYCSNSSTLPYSPFGGLWNATFGTGASGSVYTLNRGYDTRMRPTCEVDTGSGVQP